MPPAGVTLGAVALTALERLLELLDVPQEPAWHLKTDVAAGQWLTPGTIEFCGASLRYGAGLPLAVKQLSIKIESAQRIGICGRTGAGKSRHDCHLLSKLLQKSNHQSN